MASQLMFVVIFISFCSYDFYKKKYYNEQVYSITRIATSLRIQQLNRMEKELEASKYKAENDLQVLVEEQTKFNTSTSHSSQDLIRMNMVDASITKTKKDLQDLAKEQEIVQMKASLMTQELRLEELEGSKTELEKALQTCVEKQKYLEMKAYLLSLREKAVTKREYEAKKRERKSLCCRGNL
nr:PREDICTED: uncharacterized protein LOC108218229 [Daucus carota subsp. sativus]